MSANKLSRYDLVAVVAQGKLGPIWDGYDPDIRRKVTIKVAPVEHLSEQAADALVARFRTEAQVAGKLLHPNIVGVYDAGVDAGLAYIVTETVVGASLDALLRQTGGMPQEAVGRIALQVLAALDFAHARGVAHLGLQPAQVTVTPAGGVKVSDFGAVAATEADDSTRAQASLSEHIRLLAPEQVLGLQADPRADQWAVGVLLYRLWTGHWPFDAGSDFGLIQQIIKQPPQPPSQRGGERVPPLGAEHDALIARALAKKPEDRYASARDFATDLSRIVAREAASGTLTGTANTRAAVLNAVASAAAAARPVLPSMDVGSPPTPAESGVAPTIAPAAEPVDELSQWKRIQSSDAAADFEAFLLRFPEGGCADLARRRLRRLAGADDSSIARPAPAPALVDDEATRVIPRVGVAAAIAATSVAPPLAPVSPPPAVPAVPVAPVARAAASPAPSAALPAKSKLGLMAALGCLLIVGVGAVWLLMQRSSVEDGAASALAGSSPAAISASAVAGPPSVPPEPASAAPSAVTPPVIESAAPAVAAAPPASTPASASAVPARPNAREVAPRKATAEAAARARAAASGTAQPAPRPADDERSRAPAPVVAETPKPVDVSASVALPAPNEPCGKRVLLARFSCMKEACVSVQWRQHPQCVEWRRLEDNQRRGEQQN